MKRSIIIQVICYFFFALFIYTALSKWLIYPTFVKDLHRSPLTGPYATFISIVIPASEFIVAILLQFRRTRTAGLIGAFSLMLLFTIYVGYVLGMTTERPCSCGGILRDMNWPSHMYFNSVSTIVAALGIWLNVKEQRSKGNTHELNSFSSI